MKFYINGWQRVQFGLSEKIDGGMRQGNKNFYQNRINFLKRQVAASKVAIFAEQSHSTKIKKISGPNNEKPRCDALLTKQPDLILTINVADCLPVYFFDPSTKTIGLAHCGWRGVSGLLPKKLIRSAGGNLNKIQVFIGPGIQQHHFEIKKDTLSKFKNYPKFIKKKDSRIYVDLPGIIKTQLLESGISKKNIRMAKACTFCLKNRFFSHRRQRLKKPQAMLAYITI